MNLHLDPNLAFGKVPCSRNPPQLETAFVAKATLLLRPDEPAVWADEPDPVSGDLYRDGDPTKELYYPSDFAPFKPRGDVIVCGTAHASGGPASSVLASVRVGSVRKSLRAVGDRVWQGGVLGSTASAPAPFERMPLTWANAFGGPGFARNPVGAGRADDRVPNVEDAARPNRGPRSGEPAGFGPIDRMWEPRAELIGTYGGDYVKERWPWFPSDFDWGYFNAAPRDQQVDGYLKGDEELEFHNLHPDRPLFKSRLPGVRVRCFLYEHDRAGRRLEREVPMVLDTVWIDLDAGRMVLAWRGVAPVRTLKLTEIDDVQYVTEPLDQPPQPAAAYFAAVAAAATVVEPEMPDEASGREQAEAEFEKEFADADRRAAEIEKEAADVEAEAERVLADQRDQMARQGIELGDAREPDVIPLLTDVTAAVAATVAALRQTDPAKAGQFSPADMDEFVQMEKDAGAMELEAGVLRTEMAAVAAAPFAGRPVWTRQAVFDAVREGRSLAEQDLTGLDLSGLEGPGADFAGAVLNGAKLTNARLAKAHLTAADLTGANLAGADLGGANLDRADLTGAVLTGAVLLRASLTLATLSGQDLAGADLSGASGREADWSGAKLAGSNWIGAKFPEADFSGADLTGASFIGADLRAARLYGATAPKANFDGANLTGLQASEGADLSGATFRQSRAEKSLFEHSTLDGADFTAAVLKRAQFSDASLRAARFDRADLTSAMLDGADLTGASLVNANLLRAGFEQADLTRADLRDANGFEAGFWLARTDDTDRRGTNLKSSLLG